MKRCVSINISIIKYYYKCIAHSKLMLGNALINVITNVTITLKSIGVGFTLKQILVTLYFKVSLLYMLHVLSNIITINYA